MCGSCRPRDSGRRSGGNGRGAGSRGRRSALLGEDRSLDRSRLDYDRVPPDHNAGPGRKKRRAIDRGQSLRAGNRRDPVGVVLSVQQHGAVAGTTPVIMRGEPGTNHHQCGEQAQSPYSDGSAETHEKRMARVDLAVKLAPWPFTTGPRGPHEDKGRKLEGPVEVVWVGTWRCETRQRASPPANIAPTRFSSGRRRASGSCRTSST